ncbi:MAG TPA: hypothetical protein DCX03_11655, partial [Bacteroidales bacterium]|nr:hypothetical protein [Bacteroidales bacterium]
MDRKIVAHARKAHWQVAHAKHDQNQPKSFPFPSQDKKQRNANTQYKTVGVQWFARVWSPLNRFPWWIMTQPENPTVSYCQPLAVIVNDMTMTL